MSAKAVASPTVRVETTAEPYYIPLAYDPTQPHKSASRLIHAVFPEWDEGKLDFSQLTEGKTNLTLKVVNNTHACSEGDEEQNTVLLRIYGSGTHLLTDREREWRSHCVLAQNGLAPPLLARFENGLMYRFISGRVCNLADLREERTWRGIARQLAKWHAILIPLTSGPSSSGEGNIPYTIWSLAQKWISALPAAKAEEQERKKTLQVELDRLIKELSDIKGLGSKNSKLVFGHGDLLSANVIIHPHKNRGTPEEIDSVSFIDYEYCLPCPAAFDISNHFAEWAGYDCDYNLLPTRRIRRAFLREYVLSYREHSAEEERDLEEDIQQLFVEIDRFRGVPGFFWGICALIQALDPQTDFDYIAYANLRFSEYWAWRESEVASQTTELPLRERQWIKEE